MELHPDAIADLTPELQAILDDWDPLRIVDLCPDEYVGLNGAVLACLSRADDLPGFAGSFLAVAHEFCKDQDEVDAMAVQLFNWFAIKRSGHSQATAARPQLRKGRRWRSSHWKR